MSLPVLKVFNRRGGLYLVRCGRLQITCTRASLNVVKAMMIELIVLRRADRRHSLAKRKYQAASSKIAALNSQLNWEHSHMAPSEKVSV